MTGSIGLGPIVHLTTGREPFATRVYIRESRTLVEAGYEVCNVTPGGVASDDGIRVVPVRLPRNRAERMLITPWVVTWRARRLRPAAWHLHDANLIPPGLLLRLLRQRVVYDGHEILGDQVRERPWIPLLLRRVAAWLAVLLERVAVGSFSAAIFAEPAAAAGYPSRSTVTVRNFPSPEDDGPPPPSKSDYTTRDEIALYTGDITYTRGAIEMVQAMGRLPASTSARLALVGRINSPGLKEEMSKLAGWTSVDFAGRVEYADLKGYWARARLGLAVLHPTRQYLHSVPTKLFEYMAAGLPIVISDFETWRPYVVPYDCGILVDPRDVDQIAEAIASLSSNPDEAWAMGQRGRKAIEERFNWSSEGARLVALYTDLLGAPSPGASPQTR